MSFVVMHAVGALLHGGVTLTAVTPRMRSTATTCMFVLFKQTTKCHFCCYN